MDENNNVEEKTIEVKHESCACHVHPFLKMLLMALLVFFGAFCAAYTIIDWHIKSMFNPMNFERRIQKDMHRMDKMMRNEEVMPKKGGNIIHLEHMADAYKIIIDLRAFDNNENNVSISTENNVLTVSGRSVKKSAHKEQISRFQQSYMFGDDVKLDALQKDTDKNHLVITIPIERESIDEE